jgi:hypothetical protein
MSHYWLVVKFLFVILQAPSVINKFLAPKAPKLLVFTVAMGAEGGLFGE